jgi:DNA primase
VRAKKFLADRNILDEKLIQRFQLGFSDRTLGLQLDRLPSWQSASSRGALQRVGVLKPSGHEFFRGALVFLFFDEQGHIAGAYGRRITQKLKAYSVYHVHWISDEMSFFNIDALKKYKHILLCKSPLEAMSLLQLGIENVVSIMGAKSFSDAHLRVLRLFNTECIGIVFDNDIAHQKVAISIADRLGPLGIQSYKVSLPTEMDVNRFCMEISNPKDTFMQYLSSATSMTTLH